VCVRLTICKRCSPCYLQSVFSEAAPGLGSQPTYTLLFAFPRVFSLYACLSPLSELLKLWDVVRTCGCFLPRHRRVCSMIERLVHSCLLCDLPRGVSCRCSPWAYTSLS
jgi:hypothetical protein